ncbi:hypothetical protein ACQ4PT_059080 [Festuca glaucescens]
MAPQKKKIKVSGMCKTKDLKCYFGTTSNISENPAATSNMNDAVEEARPEVEGVVIGRGEEEQDEAAVDKQGEAEHEEDIVAGQGEAEQEDVVVAEQAAKNEDAHETAVDEEQDEGACFALTPEFSSDQYTLVLRFVAWRAWIMSTRWPMDLRCPFW